jgi:hypothetical protein
MQKSEITSNQSLYTQHTLCFFIIVLTIFTCFTNLWLIIMNFDDIFIYLFIHPSILELFNNFKLLMCPCFKMHYHAVRVVWEEVQETKIWFKVKSQSAIQVVTQSSNSPVYNIIRFCANASVPHHKYDRSCQGKRSKSVRPHSYNSFIHKLYRLHPVVYIIFNCLCYDHLHNK